ncbi:MAG: hypothetical protein JO112_11645 [Planctomycetes bacterium]|nr:hypothetical protein [Planctomycetota bacterium]
MQELLPVLIGLVMGGLCCRIGSVRLRGVAVLLLSPLGGALATTLNQEWAAGVVPFLADTAFVATAGLGTVIGLAVLGHLRQKATARPVNP